jgi:hypothetical protein
MPDVWKAHEVSNICVVNTEACNNFYCKNHPLCGASELIHIAGNENTHPVQWYIGDI